MRDRMKKVVLHSGGIDSTTLLYMLLESGVENNSVVLPVLVHYGQSHAIELVAAGAIHEHAAEKYGRDRIAPAQQIDLSRITDVIFKGSTLTDPDAQVPVDGMDDSSTVVPNRNMVLLSLATAVAMSEGADCVAYAPHADDHAVYPDCRPRFMSNMARAIHFASNGKVQLVSPFITISKSVILQQGTALGVPYELTWSCYRGGEAQCGVCHACMERKRAFEMAEVGDSTIYLEG